MEKLNKRIIYEGIAINNAYHNELNALGDEYDIYHQKVIDAYDSIGRKLNQILGFSGGSMVDFANYVSTIDLTSEQKRALSELRRDPWLKKLMGEMAMQQKSVLESLLGTNITAQGMAFGDENGVSYATKTEEQLDSELNAYCDKLSELLSLGVITDEQYEKYDQDLFYIYSYYISQSKGEQIPLNKLSDAEYKKIEEQAYISSTTLNEEINILNSIKQDEHNELQELQSQHINR